MDYTYQHLHPMKKMQEPGINNMPALAMTYSPAQPWECVYCAKDGLSRGTIFHDLDKPFFEGACLCV